MIDYYHRFSFSSSEVIVTKFLIPLIFNNRLIEVLFEKAREHSPSIIIIDDLEYLEYNSNGGEDMHDLQKQQLAFEIKG